MEMYDLGAGRRLTLTQGDITDEAVDAIVNAASTNPRNAPRRFCVKRILHP